MNQVDTPQTRCRAGVARGDITPPIGIYHRMWGAALHDRAEAVHRPLLATLLWLEPLAETGSNEPGQLVVALDHCILDSAEMTRLREVIHQAVSLPPEQIQIALSHTHGSGWMSRSRAHLPGGELIGPYLDGLARQLASLAQAARENVQPATITYGQGRCALAAHRDYWDAERRQFVCGFNPAGPADDTLLVGRLTDAAGRVLATLVNYACHPTTLAWENTALSPDYVGAMRELVEQHTGAPCLFLQGASGDLGPREGFVGDRDVADRNGRQLGFAVLAALEALPPAGTRFVYQGPVLSGATLGTWKHEPLDETTLQQQARWHCTRWTVELPYRLELPTLEQTEAELQHWQAQEAEARAADDEARLRDGRARVERLTRQKARLLTLPPGRSFPYPLTLWQLGDARWLFVPGELYQTFQVTLRQRFPDHPLLIATLTGDWQPGYLPAASSYGYGIYQDVIAALAPGSLETLIEAVARRLRKD